MPPSDDVGDPSDWKGDAKWVSGLDASLRCELCYDIFVAPVSLRACGHAFCSACIRTHINQPQARGQFCPKCRQPKAYDSELVLQPALEVAAHVWRLNRARLRDTLESRTRDAALIARLEARVQFLEDTVGKQSHQMEDAAADGVHEPPDIIQPPPDEIQEELFDRSSEPVEGAEPGLCFPPSSQFELAALRRSQQGRRSSSHKEHLQGKKRARRNSNSSSGSDDFEVLEVQPPEKKSQHSHTPQDSQLKGDLILRTRTKSCENIKLTAFFCFAFSSKSSCMSHLRL